MRDHLAHRYFDTNHAVLRATIDRDLPELERAVHALAETLPTEDEHDENPPTRLSCVMQGAAGLPEIHFCHPRPVRWEPVPVVIRHTHKRPHNHYCALAIVLTS
jgi:hypothetical protein